MEPWLNPSDFISFFNLPETFGVEEKLPQHVRDVVDDWLDDLLGSTRLEEMRVYLQGLIDIPSGTHETAKDALYGLIKKFLLNASWSIYVLHANAMPTETGLVTKETSSSSPISDRQRSELHLLYKGRAERAAKKVVKGLIEPADCGITRRSKRPSFKIAQRKPTSYF